MVQIFPVNAVGGADIFPTTAGTYLTDDMPGNFDECTVYFEFFSDAAGTIPAVATAGTLSAKISPMGNTYLDPSNGATINAADVSSGAYTPAILDGLGIKGKVTTAGITGAAYCKAIFVRK